MLYWQSFVGHHSDVVQPALHRKVAYSSIMDSCRHTALRVSKMQDQNLLTLWWCSVLRHSSDFVETIYALKGGELIDVELMWPCSPVDLARCNANNRWDSFDAHYYNRATSMSVAFFSTTPTNTVRIWQCSPLIAKGAGLQIVHLLLTLAFCISKHPSYTQ